MLPPGLVATLVHPKRDDRVAKHGFAQDMGFADFVDHLSENMGFLDDPALSTRSQLLLDTNNMLLPDVVLRYERITADFEMMAALVAARRGITLPALDLSQEEASIDFGARCTRPPRIMVREMCSGIVNFFYYHFPAMPPVAACACISQTSIRQLCCFPPTAAAI